MFIINPTENVLNRGSASILLKSEILDKEDAQNFLQELDSDFDPNGDEYYFFSAFDDGSILFHADEDGEESDGDLLLIGESARLFKSRVRDKMRHRLDGLKKLVGDTDSIGPSHS